MEITLEKIELVKDRTGVSYKEAKEALEAANGSVVDAIIDIEDSIGEKTKGKVGESGHRMVEKIKEIVKKGNVSKIVIKKDDEIVLNLPINIGIVGTAIAPVAMVLGVLTAFGTKCVIEIVKDDGSIIDISEMATETFEEVIDKGSAFADEVKHKGADVYQNVKNMTSEALSKVKKDREEEFCCDHDGAGSDDGDDDYRDDKE